MAYPLHRAIETGDVDQIKQLIQAGHDVNAEDEHGMTPLYIRSMQRSPIVYLNTTKFQEENKTLQIEQLLLQAGANPNKHPQSMQWPLLTLAIRLLKLESMHLLLCYGADPNLEDTHGDRPIYHAINTLFSSMTDHNSGPLLSLLYHPKIDRVQHNRKGITPFDQAILSFIKIKLQPNAYLASIDKSKASSEQVMMRIIKAFLLKGVNLHQNSLYYSDKPQAQLNAIEALTVPLRQAFSLFSYHNTEALTILNDEHKCVYFMRSELYPFLQASIAKTHARIAYAQHVYRLPDSPIVNSIMRACATTTHKMAFFNSPRLVSAYRNKTEGLLTSTQWEYAQKLHALKLTLVLFLRQDNILCLDVKFIIVDYVLDSLNFAPLDISQLPLQNDYQRITLA